MPVTSPALSISKSFNIAGDGDQKVDSTSDVINYTITVGNAGNVAVSGVTVGDAFTGGATFSGGDTDADGKLDVGETWTYTSSHAPTQGEIDAGKTENTTKA